MLCLSLAAGLPGVVDDTTALLASGLRSQGLPAVIVVVQHTEALPPRGARDAVRECTAYGEAEYGGAGAKVLARILM